MADAPSAAATPAPDFRRIFEALPGRLLLLDPQLRIVAATDAYLEVVMARRSDLIGKGVFEAFPGNPADPGANAVANLRASFQRVLRNRVPDLMALQRHDVRRPGGTETEFEERHWSVLNSPVLAADGSVAWIVNAVEDVTELVRSREDFEEKARVQQRLLDSRQVRVAQLLSFVQQAPASIAMFDREMNYLAASACWIEEHGHAHEDFVGRNHYEIFPDVPDRWREVHRRALAGETLKNQEDLWVRADGSEMWLRWTCQPWLDGHGRIGGIMMIGENITPRKRAERALREADARFRRVMDACQIGLFESDPATGEAKWNDVEFHLLGLAAGEAPASVETFFRSVHPADIAGLTAAWEKAKRSGRLDAEFRVVLPDGRERWLAGYGQWESRPAANGPVPGTNGALPMFLGVNFDITERKLAEQARDDTERSFAAIVNSALDAIITIDSDRRIVMFNRAAEQIFRCPFNAAIGTLIDRFIPMRHLAAHAEHVRRFEQTGVTSRRMGNFGPLSALRADGEEFPIEASISRIEAGGRKLGTVILRDITERLRLEREVLEVSAHEQRRIARDLHDDVGQWLAGTELLCSAVAEKARASAPDIAAEITKIGEYVREALVRTRTLARGLIPSVLETHGLAQAFKDLAAASAQMFRITCRYEGPDPAPVTDQATGLDLYRIAQEAINNAVRHGGARTVVVALNVADDASLCVLTVSNDGTGMEESPSEGVGMGLRNMRYRAASIGGTVKFGRLPDGGVSVTCEFPLKPRAKPAENAGGTGDCAML